jgi:uncharacterized protein with PQ loop repeat
MELKLFSMETLGIIATLVGIISFIPVALFVHKTKKTHNFPYNTLYLAILSNILWIIYGIFAHDSQAPLLSGSLYFLVYAFILYTKMAN